jgi:hypothetical protein
MALAGKNGVVTLGGNDQVKVTRWNLTESKDAVDVTGFDSAGAREYVSGLFGATISCEAHWEESPGGTDVGAPPDITSDVDVAFQLDTDTVPARRVTGNAVVTGATIDVAVEGSVDYTFDMTVNGAWVEV